MKTKSLKGQRLRRELKRGVDEVVDVVKLTVGPHGRNVVLEREYNTPIITNDGVSVAKEVDIKQKFRNLGVAVTKDLANKQNIEVGDGTTTVQILAQEFFRRGVNRLSFWFFWRRVNPIDLKRGMDKAGRDIVKALRDMSVEISSPEDIKRVALISSESEEIAKVVTEMIEKVGKDGVIKVSESKGKTITSEVAEGMELPNGYVSPYMVTDLEKREAVLEDPMVLITDHKLENLKDFVQLVKDIQGNGSGLVVISDEIAPAALHSILKYTVNSPFKIVCIKAPGFADERIEWLEDIASVVGAQVVSKKNGATFSQDKLGKCSKIIVEKDKTVIIGGEGDASLRKSQINLDIEKEFSEYGKEKLKTRLARLSGGIGLIRVGASTETEMRYLKDKVDDTVNATKRALEEGVVAGGGIALAQISTRMSTKLKGSKGLGYEIVRKSLTAPLKQILLNSGVNPKKVIDEVKQGRGYDAKKGKFLGDMHSAGIIDPSMVTKSAVLNSVSAVGVLLTTEAAIVSDE